MSVILGAGLVLLGLAVFVLRLRRRGASTQRTSSANRQSSNYDLRGSTTADDLIDEGVLVDSESPEAVASVRPKTGHVMALSVMASPRTCYEGYELLQALLTNGLRFGDRNVFHRYEGSSGSSNVLFSLVSVTNPGTFELSKMGEFKTPGLMLYMECDHVNDVAGAFLKMKETAIRLCETLGGTVCDQNREPLSAEAMSLSHEECMV